MKLPDVEVSPSASSVRRPPFDLRDDGRDLRDIVTDRLDATADRRPSAVSRNARADTGSGSILGLDEALAESVEAELWFG